MKMILQRVWRSFRNLFRRPFRKWRNTLDGVRLDLEQLMHSTEGEFLMVGERLQDYFNNGGNCSGSQESEFRSQNEDGSDEI